MELALDRHNHGPKSAIVNKILKDKDGRPKVIVADNTILDTRMYYVEYDDGYKTAMTANAIASNLFYQVNQGRHHIFVYRRHTDQGGGILYIYVQWKQEEERYHQRMGSFNTMERWEFYLEPS